MLDLWKLILALLVICGSVFGSGEHSYNGYALPSMGEVRVLVVFAQPDTLCSYCPEAQMYPANWPKGQLPSFAASIIDTSTQLPPKSYISSFFYQASLGNLSVVGDYIPFVVPLRASGIEGRDFKMQHHVFRAIDSISGGGDIETATGIKLSSGYFDIYTANRKLFGKPKPRVPDGYIDLMLIILPCTPGNGYSGSYASFDFGGLNTGGYKGVNSVAVAITSDPLRFPAYHEIAHIFVGHNNMHNGGKSSRPQMPYFHPGRGLLALGAAHNFSASPWDRYRMGWHLPGTEGSITDAYGACADILPSNMMADSITVYLRDFGKYGDACRIKLSSAPLAGTAGWPEHQWLWLTNNQYLNGQFDTIFCPRRGIKADIQIGADNFETFHTDAHYLVPLNRLGSHDFSIRNHNNSCCSIFAESGAENPLTGMQANYLPINYKPGATKLNVSDAFVPESVFIGGQQVSPDSCCPRGRLAYGSVFDVFPEGHKIGIGTNPSSANRPVMRSYGRAVVRNRYSTVYLSGLSVEVGRAVYPDSVDGAVVPVHIRRNDYRISQDRRWCGNIVLPDSLVIGAGAHLRIEWCTSPLRINNPSIKNGGIVFSGPSVAQCPKLSAVVAENGAAISLSEGSVLRLDSLASINLEAGAALSINDSSSLRLRTGSKFFAAEGAVLHLAHLKASISFSCISQLALADGTYISSPAGKLRWESARELIAADENPSGLTGEKVSEWAAAMEIKTRRRRNNP
jgi:hypothetical protein